MKTWKATGCVLLAGIFWGSMGLFVRQLNAAGLYAIDVMQLRVLASAIFVGLYLLLFDRQKLRLCPRDRTEPGIREGSEGERDHRLLRSELPQKPVEVWEEGCRGDARTGQVC